MSSTDLQDTVNSLLSMGKIEPGDFVTHRYSAEKFSVHKVPTVSQYRVFTDQLGTSKKDGSPDLKMRSAAFSGLVANTCVYPESQAEQDALFARYIAAMAIIADKIVDMLGGGGEYENPKGETTGE